jgi:hypothetical protein
VLPGGKQRREFSRDHLGEFISRLCVQVIVVCPIARIE